jgi:hypothetical protein
MKTLTLIIIAASTLLFVAGCDWFCDPQPQPQSQSQSQPSRPTSVKYTVVGKSYHAPTTVIDKEGVRTTWENGHAVFTPRHYHTPERCVVDVSDGGCGSWSHSVSKEIYDSTQIGQEWTLGSDFPPCPMGYAIKYEYGEH